MKQRLGDILLAQGALDALQLQAALAYQRTWGVPLGQVVVDQRFCTAGQVLQALAAQTGLPAVELDAQTLDLSLARLVPVKVAEAHRVVPLRVEGPRDTLLVVAIAAPATLTSLDAVKSVSGKGRVTPHLATDAAVQRAIRRLYYPEDALVSPSAVAMAPIVLPEADADAPFEVEPWAAGMASAAPESERRAPPQRPGGATPVPFAAAQRPSGATPAPFAPPQRPSGATPAPFAPPAPPQRPSGAMPSPFPPHAGDTAPAGTPVAGGPGPSPSPPAAAPAPFRPPAGATPPPLPSARRSGSFPAVQGGAAQPAVPTGVRVLVYGWGTEATAALLRSLGPEGLPVQVASTADVLAADARAVVVAPLPAMEGVGQRVRAQLIVAGKAPEVDLVRAQALGAKGFLAAPLDEDLLLRAVRRLRRAIEAEPAAGKP